MTTPQSELYRLANSIDHLTRMFEGDEDHIPILDRIKIMHEEVTHLRRIQERLEHQMSMIIKLLIKNEKI
jgi:hypothetical protein